MLGGVRSCSTNDSKKIQTKLKNKTSDERLRKFELIHAIETTQYACLLRYQNFVRQYIAHSASTESTVI